jgi:ketosteroid isomerase-like protein
MDAATIHSLVETGVNTGDVDALVALYEPDATLLGEDGSELCGHAAIREGWAAVVAFGGRMEMTTLSAVEVGDLALLSNRWSYELGGAVVASSITAEVARRQADGSWRYVIDNPYAAPAP